MSNQKVIKSILQASTIVAFVGLLLASSGCSTLPQTQNQILPAGAAEATESPGVYEVQLQGTFGKASTAQGVIDGPITVQTVLERSGAIKKFRNMEITVLRVVQNSGRGIKLPVDYQAGKKSVRPEQDYAIHANDRIMIQAISNSAIDKIVDSISQ